MLYATWLSILHQCSYELTAFERYSVGCTLTLARLFTQWGVEDATEQRKPEEAFYIHQAEAFQMPMLGHTSTEVCTTTLGE